MAFDRALRRFLLLLLAFLAATALAGGLALLMGSIAPPMELLAGTPFRDYTVPGLALLVLVGGGASAAAALLWRGHPRALAASMLAGLMIVGFEAVEIWAIGSEPGVARNLQLLYLATGLAIGMTAIALWRRAAAHPAG